MTTEVYINGQIIDLDEDSTVSATYGNITFGEMNKRKGVKAVGWTAPFTNTNKLVLENCEISSSESDIPYRDNTIRVDIEGVPVFEGFCIVTEASDGYEIDSYAGASDFYSHINATKLSALDLSAYNHIWGEAAIRNSWTAIDGYVYAFVNYGREQFFTIGDYPQVQILPPSHMMPQVFLSTVIKAIASDAGYTVSGDVLNNDRFLHHVIIANKFPVPIIYGGTFDISTVLPDVMQSKVWLDFANIYGLQFDINDATKEIRCIYIDDLLFNDPEDWTDKVDRSEKNKTKYRVDDYGQSSFLRFKSDSVTDQNGLPQDYSKEISIDDRSLDPEKDIYKSDFYLPTNRLYPFNENIPYTNTFNIKSGQYAGIWDSTYTYFQAGLYVWKNGTYYVSTDVSLNKDPASNPNFWQPKTEKDIWDIKSKPMYGILSVDLASPMKIAFSTPTTVNRVIKATGLEWPTSYSRHWKVFSRIIKKTKLVDILIKLNYADINQVSFDRLKIIDGEMYVLEEITQFKLNKPDSTICKFIRL